MSAADPSSSPDSTSIRPATPADVPLILQFIRELATYEKLLGDVEASQEKLKATLFPADARPPPWRGLRPVSRSISSPTPRSSQSPACTSVRPESRGKGLGKALLLHLARVASDLGCGRMEWSVLDWNAPSIEFYRRLGAVPLNEWTTFRLTGAALDSGSRGKG